MTNDTTILISGIIIAIALQIAYDIYKLKDTQSGKLKIIRGIYFLSCFIIWLFFSQHDWIYIVLGLMMCIAILFDIIIYSKSDKQAKTTDIMKTIVLYVLFIIAWIESF